MGKNSAESNVFSNTDNTKIYGSIEYFDKGEKIEIKGKVHIIPESRYYMITEEELYGVS